MSIENMKSQAKYLREATDELAELIEFAERWVYLNKQVPGAVVHTTRSGAKKWKIRKDQLPKKEKAPAKATKAKAKPKEAAKKKDTGLTIEELRRRLGWDLPSPEPKSSGLTPVRSGEREPFKHPTSGKIGQLPGKHLSDLDKGNDNGEMKDDSELNDLIKNLFEQQYKKDLDSERFKSETPEKQKELIERAMERTRNEITKVYNAIKEKDPKMAINGTFHPSNSRYRKLFEDVTGEKLPSGANATVDFLKNFIGKEKIDSYFKAIDDKKAQEQKAKEEKEKLEYEQSINSIKEKIKSGEQISGDDLVEAAKHFKIDIHPRTVGMLRKRVHSVNHEGAKITGRASIGASPYSIYNKIKAMLNSSPASQANAPEAKNTAIEQEEHGATPQQAKEIAKDHLVDNQEEYKGEEATAKEPWEMTREEFSKQKGIAFHGTNSGDFGDFDDSKIGSSTDDGLLGAGHYFGTDKEGMSKGRRTMIPGKVEIKNPLLLSMPDFKTNKNELINREIGTSGLSGTTLTKKLKEMGHDGVILDYSPAGYNHQEKVAFSSSQIKTHRSSVEDALRSGKPVPPEVIADYPDLAAKYAKPDNSPKEGDRNAEGLVFRNGRWHREEEENTKTSTTNIENEVNNEHLERESDSSDQGRISAGEPVGKDAGKAPESAIPESSQGLGGGPEGLSNREDIGSLRTSEPDRGSGDRPAIVEGDRSGLPAPQTGPGEGKSNVLGDRGGDREREGGSSEKASTKENPTDVNSSSNFHYKNIEFGGLKKKFSDNFSAIRTLKNIEAEGRDYATPEEQEILSRYVGWGQFPALFNNYGDNGVTWQERQELKKTLSEEEWNERFDNNTWWDERTKLQSILSDDEWASARASTLNAHYTHPDIVKAHWDIAKKLGFDGGRFLETSAGIGYYLGMMPSELSGKTKSTAVELDSVTGRMLKLLYPETNVKNQGFEKFKSPDNFYDLVASNVPFGNFTLHDPRYNKFDAKIHDYFFLKSVDLASPGGLVMHITSTGTMDKSDSEIRKELMKKCDLVAAIRIPWDTHKKNAGTSVVTDLIILRKKHPDESPENLNITPVEAQPKKPGFTGTSVDSLGRLYYWVDGKRVPGPKWDDIVQVPDPDGKDPIPVNRYFAEHPEQILGRLDRTGSMYKADSVNVSSKSQDDFKQKLQDAIDRLPENVAKKFKAPKERFEPEVMPAPGDVRDGGYAVKNGKLFQRQGGGLTEQESSPKDIEKIRDHLAVRDAVREVINQQLNGIDTPESRKNLNDIYDGFVKKHGFLNERSNKNVFRGDPDSPVLLALEKWDPETKTASKADIFFKNTIRPFKRADKADTTTEALGISLNENGRIDIERLAQLTGKSIAQISQELVDQELAFKDPSDGWQPANQYLSGNVRQKLVNAISAAESDPYFKVNVEALKKVQPEDIDYADIELKMGVPWIPPSDIANFAAFLLNGNASRDFNIQYNAINGKWIADFSNQGKKWIAKSEQATKVWTTQESTFDTLFESALNGVNVTIYAKDADGNSYVDKRATDDANAKIEEMKEEFRKWIWEDDERRERLHRYYNDNFNNIRPIHYDGSHQTFPGMNPAIKLRDHQKDFVWQVVTTGKGLAAHEVGTGKTFSMIASAMELRRLGLAKKPCIACLKANVESITADAQRLYPGAKILSTSDMFDAKSRKKTISQIATGDYDMVIMTHDHLDLLQMKPEVVEQYVNEEIMELEAAKKQAYQDNPKKNNRIVKQLEDAKKKLEAKLKEALDESKKDDAVFFEETGIDQVFVDEAHKYKSLPVYTSQRGLKGVPSSRSDRATQMQMRSRWLQENNNGRGVVFATGTPVANTMAELYNMQKYLQPDELKQRGCYAFDAWAKTFGDIETKMEFSVSGEYKPVSRFAKFVNIPELMQITRQVMDVQKADSMLNSEGKPEIVRPKRKDNVVIAPNTDSMKDYIKSLQERAKKLKGFKVEKGSDNMLNICNDGRKAALDMRMVNSLAKDDPNSKTNLCVKNVLNVFKNNPGKTQLIFSDVGVNKAENGFHLYSDIIKKLVAGGIPKSKIADFSKLKDNQKEEVMEKMRKGEILVGIGSTEKMGTGVNVQDHLSDLHHLDVPYLPSSVEQRDGRGWRQGNKNSQVNIHRYVSEGSLDQTFWQIIGNKTKFIKQVVTPGSTVSRVAKEEDTEELSPEQLMAAASGDPRILEKVNLDEDVKQLKAGLDRHNRNLVKLKQTISKAEQNVPELDSIAKRYEEAANHLDKNQDFSLEFDGKHYDNRKDASEAIDKALQDHDKYWGGYNNKPIGKYRGLEIRKIGSDVYLNTPGSPGNGIKTGDSLGSIEYVARNMRKSHEQSKADATKYREDIEKMKLGLDKKYHKEDELKSKSTRLTDLNAELQKERNGKLEEKPEEVPAEYKKPWEMNSDEFKTHLAEKVKGSSPVDKITEVRTATIKLHGDNIRAKIYKVPGLEGLSLAVKESKSPYHKNMKYHTIVEPESGAVLGRDLLMSSDAALENVKNKINGMISKYGSKEKAIQAIMVFGAHKNDMKIPESVAKEFPDLIN